MHMTFSRNQYATNHNAHYPLSRNTVLHDNSNKYQHTGEVVISYKDIKLSLWINTETQYDNIKFAQLILLSQCYRFQQTENFF